jgi:DNA polymerase-3 subunit gamma/tau
MEECSEQGRDAGSFATDLEVRARDLLVVQTLGELPDELSLTPEADAALQAQAERVDHATIVRLLELLGEAMEAVRAGADARTRLELALVKAAKPEVEGSLRALLMRIERLEHERAGAAPATGVPRADDPPAAATAAPPVQAVPAAAAPPPPPAPPERPAHEPRADAPAQAPVEAPVEAPAPIPPDAEPPALARDLESVCSLWPAVVELVRRDHALLGALIAEARPVAVDGEDLTLAFASTAQFLKKKAEGRNNRVAVGEALRAVAGGRWRLSYELRDAGREEPEAGESTEEDWVRRFMEEFDGEEIPAGWDPGQGPADEAGREEQPVTSNEKGA